MVDFTIAPDDPRDPEIRVLLDAHRAFADQHTPPHDIHALDVEGLLDSSVSFFSCRRDGELLGIGAIRMLDANHAELKSMHTAHAARGQGVGRALVERLLGIARARGVRRVSIETGTQAAFAPARAMYERAGFERCEPFGEYTNSPNSICMTLLLG